MDFAHSHAKGMFRIPGSRDFCLGTSRRGTLPATTEEAIDAAGSLQDYAIVAQKAKVWFDAKKYDQVCQLHMYESLLSPCWKLANAYMYRRSDKDGAKMQVI